MTDIVVGKFLGMVAIFAIPVLIICLYPLIMNGPFLQSGQGLIHLLICTAAYGGIACALSIRMNRRNTRA